jgi:hypothetical protein
VASQTESQCQDQYIGYLRKNKLKGNSSLHRSAMNLCTKGDTDKWTVLLESYKCASQLKNHIVRNKLKPDEDTLRRAHLFCRSKKPDLNSAINLVGAGSEKPLAKPSKIVSFTTNKKNVLKGRSVILSWKTSNADRVTFVEKKQDKVINERSLSSSGSLSIKPVKTTTYMLIASNSKLAKQVPGIAQITIQVSDPIKVFIQASPSTIRKGGKSKLTWQVRNAEDVTLNGNKNKHFGDRWVKPNKTFTYKLIAKNNAQTVTKSAHISVSPYPPPKLSQPFSGIELCKNVAKSGKSFKCISPDGPFWIGNKIVVIVRFNNLHQGQHKMRREIYNSGIFGGKKWKKIHKEENTFKNPRNGSAEISFEIPNLGKGVLRLDLILDKKQKSSITYCVECPGHDEW